MERRVLLAISLSFLVLFLYQTLVPPPAGAAGGDDRRAGRCPGGARVNGQPGAGAGHTGARRPWRRSPR